MKLHPIVLVMCGVWSLTAAQALASDPTRDYPNRPVRVITGSPGSTSDIVPRYVAQKLAERWGQQVVDNRPGAGGIIGSEIGAKALAVLSAGRFPAAPDIPSATEAMPMTPEEFGIFLKHEIEKWGRVIKSAGIKAE